ncbi:protein kinase domain-containing protein [Kitasatospora sp. NPDC004240]
MAAVSGALIGGRYRLLDLIGQGGMGRVWRGQDETLGRDVAVKEVLLPHGLTDQERDHYLQRVLREARAAARLNHPGIITVHDVVEHEGTPAIVMEYVTGESLGALIARSGALPVQRVAEIGAAMLKALREAHAAGIVHRDLKPDNVLLMGDRVIITDFGIAHMTDATTALTRTGVVIGTPAYMAPEQLEGRPPSPANDLWSLGATLYCAVEGEAPFSGGTFGALCVAVAIKEPRPAVRAGVLAPLLGGLLTKDPALRVTAEQALATLDGVARTGVAAGAAGPVWTPTEAVRPGPVAPGPFAPTPVVVPSAAPPIGSSAQTWQPVPPAGYAPHPHPGPTAPTAPAVPAAPAATPAASAFGAVLVRFVGCMGLLWVTGTALPWNYLDRVREDFVPMALAVTGVLALIHAVPRPRWHPAAAWVGIVLFDVVLYFATKQFLLDQLHTGGTGFGEAPWQIVANMLILGTGSWLLWWKIPGSRPS